MSFALSVRQDPLEMPMKLITAHVKSSQNPSFIRIQADSDRLSGDSDEYTRTVPVQPGIEVLRESTRIVSGPRARAGLLEPTNASANCDIYLIAFDSQGSRLALQRLTPGQRLDMWIPPAQTAEIWAIAADCGEVAPLQYKIPAS
jgi:hypothetical protein